jgi:NADH dehydrogenase
MNLSPSSRKKVVVIGAGFAGLNAAKALSKNSTLDVTVIDRRNHHLFQPLLYQVATAGLSPADIAVPIRSLFANHQNVTVLLEEALEINPELKTVKCTSQILNYDFLVLACGAAHSYFGNDAWEEFAPGLKTVEQATEIRRRILIAFENAEKQASPEARIPYMNFVIVGGGPTGVELAGAIAELSHHTIRNEYHHIDPSLAKIFLVEAGPKVLAAFDDKLSERAGDDLKSLGVTVRTNTRVTSVTAEGVQTGSEWIPSKTVVWAAGVAPSKTGKSFVSASGPIAIELDKTGRVMVGKDLSLKNYPNVFVLGDQANATGADGKPLPGLAPVAMQQGTATGHNIIRLARGEATREFKYKDKGFMATIGRKRAVVETKEIKFAGFIAWCAWLFIHIFYLIGFQNRLVVFFQWFWSYLTYSRSARLIVDKDWHLKK